MGELSVISVTDKLELIRNKNRPTVNDYIPLIFDNFMEFRGDRHYGDDKAIVGGIATLGGSAIPVTVIAQVKGRNIDENKKSNFSMPHPEGYRKALRLAKQAEKFRRPVICLVDTPGAFCGIEAEKRGQGQAIAQNLMEFMTLRTPVISVVLGEGGSGGALALAVCDELMMLENALYSVISPRGFASILWKDPTREKEAAELMKITAEDLCGFGVCERIIPEPTGGAHNDVKLTAANIYSALCESVSKYPVRDYGESDLNRLLDSRYDKFRKIGMFDFVQEEQI
ncbi:MAG: acetyl-CoA carboxylase carboxyltransferase subunit alpha [Oscillospiraceae bacterium]|nr:acetyl-CoA carboxylase carboxyltransferase subunit alpha [Oscillospiraceae bacterium]